MTLIALWEILIMSVNHVKRLRTILLCSVDLFSQVYVLVLPFCVRPLKNDIFETLTM